MCVHMRVLVPHEWVWGGERERDGESEGDTSGKGAVFGRELTSDSLWVNWPIVKMIKWTQCTFGSDIFGRNYRRVETEREGKKEGEREGERQEIGRKAQSRFNLSTFKMIKRSITTEIKSAFCFIGLLNHADRFRFWKPPGSTNNITVSNATPAQRFCFGSACIRSENVAVAPWMSFLIPSTLFGCPVLSLWLRVTSDSYTQRRFCCRWHTQTQARTTPTPVTYLLLFPRPSGGGSTAGRWAKVRRRTPCGSRRAQALWRRWFLSGRRWAPAVTS